MPTHCATAWRAGVAPMACPTLKSLSRSVHCPAAPPAVLALIRLTGTCPGANTPKPSCDSCPIAPIGGIPVAPTTRAATIASSSASGIESKASAGAMPNRLICSATTSVIASARPAAGQPCGRHRRDPRRVAVRERSRRSPSEVSVAQTIRLTPGHSSHSISVANCGPVAAAGRRTRPSASSQGASSPHASSAPSSNDKPTRRPTMPPKPTSSSDGSKVKVSRSSCAEGAQRGRLQKKVSISLVPAASSAALPSTHNRRPASAPWL